jgi:hypothetical protein
VKRKCGNNKLHAAIGYTNNPEEAEALGHASVAFTMDTYSHIISGMQEDAMEMLDEILPPGVSKNKNVAKMS